MKKHINKKYLYTIAVILMALAAALAACSQKEADTPQSTQEPEETSYEPDGSEATEATDKSIRDILLEAKERQLVETNVYWSYFQTLNYRAADIADNYEIDSSGYFTGEMTQENIDYITNTLLNTEYEVLDEAEPVNTDFHVDFKYDNSSEFALNLGETHVYMSVFYDGQWQYIAKVLDENLYEYILALANEEMSRFSFDKMANTESITIYYVKNEDLKDFEENRKITKIEIEDAEIISEIVSALKQFAVPTMTYPSRESSDIVFHTAGGDVYGKIKFPIGEEEMSEATIIMEGYFWYSCPELYEILGGIEN